MKRRMFPNFMRHEFKHVMDNHYRSVFMCQTNRLFKSMQGNKRILLYDEGFQVIMLRGSHLP